MLKSTLLIALLAVSTLVSCADGDSGFSPGTGGSFNAQGVNGDFKSSCSVGYMCVEIYGDVGSQDPCSYLGSSPDPCSQQDLAGQCKVDGGGFAEVIYFYSGSGFSPSVFQQQCSSMGGTFH